jgi:hypothetical protein
VVTTVGRFAAMRLSVECAALWMSEGRRVGERMLALLEQISAEEKARRAP